MDLPPAQFEIIDLRVAPENPKIGDTLTILVDVQNKGDFSGSYTVLVTIGSKSKTQNVDLEGKSSKTVEFQDTVDTEGDIEIKAGNLTKTISVAPLETPAPTTTPPTTTPAPTTTHPPTTTPKPTTTPPPFESRNEYFPTEPGYYVLYKVTDTGPPICNCEMEMVFQYPNMGEFYATLITTEGNGNINCVIAGEIIDGLLRFNHGCPCGNQANYFMDYLILPPKFNNENDWNKSITKYHSEKVGEVTVGSNTFNDCIKIEIDNSKSGGFVGGEMYLAKDVGIIKWVLNRRSGSPFKMEILEYGKLPQRTISGTLTIDGTTPAVGYRVQLSNCDNLGENACEVDSHGKYEIKFYGHIMILRYGPIGEYGSLDQAEKKEYTVKENVTKLDLRMF